MEYVHTIKAPPSFSIKKSGKEIRHLEFSGRRMDGVNDEVSNF
jgi:hypothetical protein